MTDYQWGEGAHDALGDAGAAGLHTARKLVKERIIGCNPDELSTYVEALDALELVLNAIGAIQPRPQPLDGLDSTQEFDEGGEG